MEQEQSRELEAQESEVSELSQRSSDWLAHIHAKVKDHPYLNRSLTTGALVGIGTGSWSGAAFGAGLGLAVEKLIQWNKTRTRRISPQ